MALKDRVYRRRSYRTREEVDEQLLAELKRLDPSELDLLRSMFKNPELISAMADLEYDEVPVSPEVFLNDDRYYGLFGRYMHQCLKEDFIDLFTYGYDEVTLSGSLGWGKSFFSIGCVSYDVYRTLCLRDPQKSYGLARGSRIIMAVISLSIEHARLGVIEDLATRMRTCPMFLRHNVQIKKSGIYFPAKNVVILPENYAAKRIIGLNVFSAFIDEANFAKKSRGVEGGRRTVTGQAKEVYESVMRRRKSRYMTGGKLPGLCIIVSSATTQSAFTEEKMQEAKGNPNIFVRTYATWDVKPAAFSKGSFYVLVASGGRNCRILEPDEVEYYRSKEDTKGEDSVLVVEVPNEYRSDFDKNLIDSLREIAGIPADAIMHLLPDHRVIDASVSPGWGQELEFGFTTREWECESEGGFVWDRLCIRKNVEVASGYWEPQWVPKLNPETPRFAHIDTSVSGDATGLCVGHVAGYTEVKRRDSDLVEYTEIAPRIIIDVILRILPPPGGEIRLGAVRALLYEMQAHGFVFAQVSTDGYQSVDTRQKLVEHGIRSELVSLDRDDVGYMKLKSALVEHRVLRPAFPHLEWELQHLRHFRELRKVDHPDTTIDNRIPCKDVADALAGVVSQIEMKRPGMRSLAVPPAEDFGMDEDDDLWVTGGMRVVQKGEPLRRL